MSILSDRQITSLCVPPEVDFSGFEPMIEPFHPNQVKEAVEAHQRRHTDGDVVLSFPTAKRRLISYGVTSYGYDVTLSSKEVKIFTNLNSALIDPKRMDARCLADAVIQTDEDGSKYFILPPNSYALGHTNEYFRMPRNILVVCVGKSTYARAGAIVNTTPIEPGFEGVVVIEISNSTSLPLKIYVDEGIAQFLFFRGTESCQISYGDRAGKYQGQTSTVLSKV